MSGLDRLSVHDPEHTTRQASKDARGGVTSRLPADQPCAHPSTPFRGGSAFPSGVGGQDPRNSLFDSSSHIRSQWEGEDESPGEGHIPRNVGRRIVRRGAFSSRHPYQPAVTSQKTINACLAAIVAFRPAAPAFQTPEAMAEDSFLRHGSSGDGEEESTPRSKRTHL